MTFAMEMTMHADVAATTAAEDEVDAILGQDPVQAYARMDPRSRHDYRERIRMWAARARRSGSEVARLAVDLAAQAGERHGMSDRRAHVGYFLTDEGIADFARALKAKLTWREKLRLRRQGTLVFAYCTLASVLCLGVGTASVLLFDIRMPWPGKVLLGLAVALFLSGIIPGWFNMVISRALVPRWMPRLDFRGGIPESAKTLVVICCLLTSREGIHKLARTLERLHLGNVRTGVGYAMLSDFVDADAADADGDEALLAHARAEISALNERHGSGFALLHRPRRWNPSEGRWIGWERKRGKLEELNAYLAGEASPFQTMHGDLGIVDGVHYVLTLDDDNGNLSPGAVAALAGAMSHPLHRPVLSEDGKRVMAGFVIMLPRTRISLPDDDEASRMEQLLQSTVDIETSGEHYSPEPTVDVDQDVFGETVYLGKGMYDALMFHRLTRGLIAENTVLNHDALESGLLRAGVVSDVMVDETFVSTFFAASRRTHRWQRGDWQQIPWLFPKIRNAAGVRVENTLSLFGRWKLMQNIMRLLFPISAILCFVAGWATSGRPGLWTLSLLAIVWLPPLFGLLLGAIRSVLSMEFGAMLRGLWAAVSMRIGGFIFGVHHARIAFDAVVRASYRMWISHRKMLEWTASIMDTTQRSLTLGQYVRLMWFSPAFAVAVLWFIAHVNPPALSSAIPFAVLWSMAPIVAWWWSQKQDGERAPSPVSPS
jgi:hypothetical protein